MRFDLVIRSGVLVLPDGCVETDLAVQGGRIAAIGGGLEGAETVSAAGCFVLPGVVDPHVHAIHAESYESVSEAALRGGVTTLGHHLYTPVTADPVAFHEESVAELAATSRADAVFHVRLNDLRRTGRAITRLAKAGSTTFKLFLAYGGRGVMVPDDELLLAMQIAARTPGARLLFHAENGHVADELERQARVRGERHLAAYYEARPDWVEEEAVRRLLILARATRAPVYLVHLTCHRSLEAVAAAKAEGVDVIAETCPHYLLLTADAAEGLGAKAKMSPPLRTAADRTALWRALADGLLDTVGSDHSAFVREEKEASDDVFEAGYGVPGIATMLSLLYDRGVRGGLISMERLMTVLASAPARAIGVAPRKGALLVGADADIVVFDPEAPFTIDATSEGRRAYYSLYEGWMGMGCVRTVFLRGARAYDAGAVLARPGDGQYLSRRVADQVEPLPAVVP